MIPSHHALALRALSLVSAAMALSLSSCRSAPEDLGVREYRVPEYIAPSTKRLTVRQAIALESMRQHALERGAVVYREACAPCHGRDGDGAGPAAGPLDPPPWDFSLGVFSRAEGLGATLEEGIFRIVSDGIDEVEMPGWRKLLAASDRWAVVLFVKQLAESDS